MSSYHMYIWISMQFYTSKSTDARVHLQLRPKMHRAKGPNNAQGRYPELKNSQINHAIIFSSIITQIFNFEMWYYIAIVHLEAYLGIKTFWAKLLAVVLIAAFSSNFDLLLWFLFSQW